MALIEWKSDYLVHIAEIDDQHQRMAALVNELFEAMSSRADAACVARIATDLVERTREHFRTEERLMKQYQYPDCPAHAREHANLLTLISDYDEEFRQGTTLYAFALTMQLRTWALEHITSSDVDLADYLKGKGVT